MSSTVAMPRLPSAAEIEKSMRERMPGLVVYNPSRDWKEWQVFGLYVWLAPDLGGAIEPHPVTKLPVKCHGRTEIKGRWLTQKDSSGKIIEGQDASAMTKYLINPDNLGQMGLVWLPGDPEEDRKLIEASRAVFSHYQEGHDEQIVSRRAEFKANWLKGPRKSEPVPPPTPAETAAMDRLQQRKRTATYSYECTVPDCPGYAVNEWERFEAHMRTAHGVKAERSKYEGDAVGFKTPEVEARESAGTPAFPRAARIPMDPESPGDPDPGSNIADAARALVARMADQEETTEAREAIVAARAASDSPPDLDPDEEDEDVPVVKTKKRR